MTQQDAATRGRFDVYGPPHKMIRHAHAALLTRLGVTDHADLDDALVDDVRRHIELLREHLSLEERFIQPALEERAPGGTTRLIIQHDEHDAHFAKIEELLQSLSEASAADRPVFGRELYLVFSLMVGDDLAHMNEEEQSTSPLMWACMSDEELRGILEKVASAVSPDTLAYALPHMAASVTLDELAPVLSALKSALPPDNYAQLFAGTLPSMSGERLAQLRRMDLAA